MEKKYERLSKDREENTIIMAGNRQLSINELEKGNTDISKKLKSVEHLLDKY